METWWKFLIAAQVLPGLLFLSSVGFLVGGLSVKTDPECIGCHTQVEIPDEWVWQQFWVGVAVARFFFLAGLPFEFGILYLERAEKKRKRLRT